MEHTNEFLNHLRPEDKVNLELIVDHFKQAGLTVFIGGSAISEQAYTGNYKDLDLVVTSNPELGMEIPDTSVLKSVIESFATKYSAKVERGPTPYSTYMGSTIVARYEVTLGNTIFDITSANEPFDFNPATKRLEL